MRLIDKGEKEKKKAVAVEIERVGGTYGYIRAPCVSKTHVSR